MKHIYAQIEKNKAWAVETLKKYIALESVSARRKCLPETAGFLRDTFRRLKISASIHKAGIAPVFFAEHFACKPAKTLLFYNHYDVQPEDPVGEWLSPPFKLTERNGMLFGRGTADNKGNLIARLWALKSYMDLGVAPPVNLKFVVEGEEESGSKSFPGFVKKYWTTLLKADYCIWESGSKDEKGRPQITLGAKGIIDLEISIECAKADMHSSNGVIVPNPAWRLAWALASLKGSDENILIDGFYDDVVLPCDEEIAAIRKIPFNEKERRKKTGIKQFLLGLSGRDLAERYYFMPALNINGLTSGYQGEGHKTVLPHKASAKLDFRLVPEQDPAKIISRLKRHFSAKGFPDVKIGFAHGYPAARTPVTDPFVKTVSEACREVYRKEPVINPMMAASTPMYTLSECLPIASIGAGHAGSNIHGPNESIIIKDFLESAKVIATIMERLI